MDRYEMRVVKPEIGMCFTFNNIPQQIKYNHQSELKVGDDIFVIEDNSIMMTRHLAIINYFKTNQGLAHRYKINNIIYKSRFRKWFKWFFKYSIKSIEIEMVESFIK